MINWIHFGETSHRWSAKIISLCGMDPYAFVMSSYIVAKDKFLDLASFRGDKTIEICSQHPGTFAIQLFYTDLFITLLLFIKCVSRNLETKLKQDLPPPHLTVLLDENQLCSVESLTFGIQISLALCHWSVIMPLFIQERKILKGNLFILGHFLWTL